MSGETGSTPKWETLKRLGLVECVPHLVEADTAEAEIIHPCPYDTGTETEQALGWATRSASDAMANEITERLAEDGIPIAVPDDKPNVQMVGVYRLRYRPHTRATSAWYAKERHWEELAEKYRAIEAQIEAGEPVTHYPTSLQRQRIING